MQLFNLVDLSKMGEKDEKFGVSYWGSDDKGNNVMFNSMSEDIIAPCTISAEETVSKTSSKGTPYFRLKKVKVAEKAPEGVTGTVKEQPVDYDVNIPTGESTYNLSDHLNRIEAKIDKLLGISDEDPIINQYKQSDIPPNI